MTEEQVEKIRAHIAKTFQGVGRVVDGETVARLLDEREALLAFARRMIRTLDAGLYQAERAECSAAIEKADGRFISTGTR